MITSVHGRGTNPLGPTSLAPDVSTSHPFVPFFYVLQDRCSREGTPKSCLPPIASEANSQTDLRKEEQDLTSRIDRAGPLPVLLNCSPPSPPSLAAIFAFGLFLVLVQRQCLGPSFDKTQSSSVIASTSHQVLTPKASRAGQAPPDELYHTQTTQSQGESTLRNWPPTSNTPTVTPIDKSFRTIPQTARPTITDETASLPVRI